MSGVLWVAWIAWGSMSRGSGFFGERRRDAVAEGPSRAQNSPPETLCAGAQRGLRPPLVSRHRAREWSTAGFEVNEERELAIREYCDFVSNAQPIEVILNEEQKVTGLKVPRRELTPRNSAPSAG